MRSVLWARSGLLDFSHGGFTADDWGAAIAAVLEVGAVAAAGAPPRPASFCYVECTAGLDVTRFPVATAFRVVRRSVDALVRGYPERGECYLIAPTTRVNRTLLALMRPFMPVSVSSRIVMLADDAAARAALGARGIAVPDFFGGPAPHELPRDARGAVDLRAMGERLRRDIEAHEAAVARAATGARPPEVAELRTQ